MEETLSAGYEADRAEVAGRQQWCSRSSAPTRRVTNRTSPPSFQLRVDLGVCENHFGESCTMVQMASKPGPFTLTE